MESDKIRFYEFGEFRVDARRGILLRNDQPVALSPRNFDLLLFLIQNEGRILSHDELLDKVWEGAFVEQANLKNAVSVLRKILGEQPKEGSYIRTAPRRGYSFVAAVKTLTDNPEIKGVHSDIPSKKEDPPAAVASSPRAEEKPLFEWLKAHPIVWVGGSVIILMLAGYGFWVRQARSVTRFSIENIKLEKLTNKGNLNGAIGSLDGNYFLYATVEADAQTLWVQQIATGSATRLTPPINGSLWFYTFTPDSNYVYYTVNNHPDESQNGLFRVPLLGGSPKRISEEGFRVLFSPDGNRVAFNKTIDGETWYLTADPDLTNEKKIISFDDQSRIWSTQWSPDGRALLFAVRKFVGDKTVHYVVEAPTDGSKESIIIPEMEKQITSAAWLPDKSSLLVCLREINADVRQIWQYSTSTGEFRRVTNDNNSYRGLTISRDGKRILTFSENSDAAIWVSDDDKYQFKQISGGTGRFGGIGWTADGRLVFSSTDNAVEAISIMNSDGSQRQQISAGNDGIWQAPRASADGHSVTIVSSRTGRKQLWRADLDGRTFTQMTNAEDVVFRGKLLLDNKTAVYNGQGKDFVTGLFLLTADGMSKTIYRGDLGEWDVSPDEKYVAYAITDPQTQKQHVVVQALESGWLYKTFEISPFAVLRWTRDSQAMSFDTKTADSSEIFIQHLDGGEPKSIAKFPAEQVISFDWSFDGKKLAVIRGKTLNDAVQIQIAENSN